MVQCQCRSHDRTDGALHKRSRSSGARSPRRRPMLGLPGYPGPWTGADSGGWVPLRLGTLAGCTPAGVKASSPLVGAASKTASLFELPGGIWGLWQCGHRGGWRKGSPSASSDDCERTSSVLGGGRADCCFGMPSFEDLGPHCGGQCSPVHGSVPVKHTTVSTPRRGCQKRA